MQQANSANSATSHQKPPAVTNAEEGVVEGCTVYQVCGEVEQGGESEINSLCPTCFSSKETSTASAGKRKAQDAGFLPKRTGRKADKSAKRTRLSLDQKMEVLAALDMKCSQETVADKFKCAVRTVQSIKKNRAALKAGAELAKGTRRPAAEASGLAAQTWASISRTRGMPWRRCGWIKRRTWRQPFNDLVVEGAESSDSEGEGDDDDDDEDGSMGGVGAEPPLHEELSQHFARLENFAAGCGLNEASYLLMRARVLMIEAHASKPSRQADVRVFFFN